jgi:anthranilate phosphoribosyltransferase
MGMRIKKPTISELTTFVQEMRSAAIPVEVDTTNAVDLCGTGGDRSGTFNISTAAMFVVAGAGVPVLKHGNRSVSSKSGSYDVLESLGAVPNLQKEAVEKLFNETGMAFMFAPNFHPALKYVMPARRALKIRTFFNMLGPMLNPAGVKNQLIGVFSHESAKIMIQILGNLQMDNVYTVHSEDGLDEVSLSAYTNINELRADKQWDTIRFDPESLGYKKVELSEVYGGDTAMNKQIILNILHGRSTKAQRDVVELNAAFAIHTSGIASSLQDAAKRAANSIDSGEAAKKLEIFVNESRKMNE